MRPRGALRGRFAFPDRTSEQRREGILARTRRRTATRSAPTLAEARRAIATEKLVKRLTDHALGKAEMSSTQVSAAFGLLKKTLPDLGTLAIGGDDASPVVEIKVTIVDPRS